MVDNTVTIVGNLTADPEIRVTDGGATLAETVSYTHLTLPTNREV